MDTATHTARKESAPALANEISAWLRDHLHESGAQRYVLGLSGGLDSAVVCGLAARGVGGDRVLGVMMPSASSPADVADARAAAEAFGVTAMLVDLTQPTTDLLAELPSPATISEAARLGQPVSDSVEQVADANVKPRLRMTALYYVANLCGGMVLGTGNRTEAMIGYFTKFGDGAADLRPLVDLYKYEVYMVAEAIGVPTSIIERSPSAGLWSGQTDEQEIGLTYDQIDAALVAIAAGDTGGIDGEVLAKVEAMVHWSAHKRKPVPEFHRAGQG